MYLYGYDILSPGLLGRGLAHGPVEVGRRQRLDHLDLRRVRHLVLSRLKSHAKTPRRGS